MGGCLQNLFWPQQTSKNEKDKLYVPESFTLTNGFDGDDGKIKRVNESDPEHEGLCKWTKGNITEQHDNDDDERTLLVC